VTASVKLLLIFAVFVGGVTALAVFSTSPPSREAPPAPAVETERPEATSTPEPTEETEPPVAQQGGSTAAAEPSSARRVTRDRGTTIIVEPDPGDFEEGKDSDDPFDDGDAPYDDPDFPFDEEGESSP
jgi:hypothetical protein